MMRSSPGRFGLLALVQLMVLRDLPMLRLLRMLEVQ